MALLFFIQFVRDFLLFRFLRVVVPLRPFLRIITHTLITATPRLYSFPHTLRDACPRNAKEWLLKRSEKSEREVRSGNLTVWAETVPLFTTGFVGETP